MPCLIKRNAAMGNLCGYVGVPASLVSDELAALLDGIAHGGVTYGPKPCEPGDPAKGICHVAEPGEPEVRWYGFDCAHAHDLLPAYFTRPELRRMAALGPGQGDTYKGVDYVKRVCERMADAVLAHAAKALE